MSSPFVGNPERKETPVLHFKESRIILPNKLLWLDIMQELVGFGFGEKEAMSEGEESKGYLNKNP